MVQSHVSYRWTTSQRRQESRILAKRPRAVKSPTPRRKLRGVGLRFDAEQRFTCRQCGRCCRRGWDIVVTRGEAEAYRRASAERRYREGEGAPRGAASDPFETVPGLRHL